MARRTFRYNRELDRMVEITPEVLAATHAVHGDIPEFVSPIDGTVIRGRAQYEDHCARYNVIPTVELEGQGKVIDRYAAERERRELREMLWQGVDAMRNGGTGFERSK